MTIAPVAPVGAANMMAANPIDSTQGVISSFGRMMAEGVAQADQKAKAADAAVTAFALNDSIPPHQAMFALAEAHRSMTMMMQVRSRLVEGYQEIMRMQL